MKERVENEFASAIVRLFFQENAMRVLIGFELASVSGGDGEGCSASTNCNNSGYGNGYGGGYCSFGGASGNPSEPGLGHVPLFGFVGSLAKIGLGYFMRGL